MKLRRVPKRHYTDRQLLEIAYDYLVCHWDMASAPLDLITQRLGIVARAGIPKWPRHPSIYAELHKALAAIKSGRHKKMVFKEKRR